MFSIFLIQIVMLRSTYDIRFTLFFSIFKWACGQATTTKETVSRARKGLAKVRDKNHRGHMTIKLFWTLLHSLAGALKIAGLIEVGWVPVDS